MASERVVVPEGLAHKLIGVYADPADWKWEDDYDEAVLNEFMAEYEVFEPNDRHLGDPNEGWYQGVRFTSLIRRKSDGKLFGYHYWEPVSKHGEAYYEGNGDEFGLDYDMYVFLPVREFTVTGYDVVKGEEDGEV